jgi:enediyne biosynthesis protein E4
MRRPLRVSGAASSRGARGLALVAATIVAACGESESGARNAAADKPPSAAPAFVDATAEAGLSFRHRSGAAGRFLLPEIMGGGAAWIDYDGDGRFDALCLDSGALSESGGGKSVAPRHRLYRNMGDGRFSDVAEEVFAAPFRGYGMGVATGDYDGDGDVDLFLTNLGRDALYRNDGGRFVDVSDEAGIVGEGWSTAAAFFDADLDGDLDLFVGEYVPWRNAPVFVDRVCRGFGGARDFCSPQAYGAKGYATLYVNRGDGTFEDRSDASGVRAKAGTALGVLCTDLDGDGRVDVYVSNDQMFSFAWLRREDGTYEEAATRLGIAVDELGKSQAGMGVDLGDVDRDGRLDLWKVHLDRESHVLYRNLGGRYVDATTRFGLAAPTRPRTGFGTAFLDYDHDGLLDLFVANGRVEASSNPFDPADPYAEPDQLLRQTAPGRFIDATNEAGPAVSAPFNSRGAAFCDFDDDGDVDVLVVAREGPARLLRNDAKKLGAWIGVRVLNEKGADVLGARVVVEAGGRKFVDEIRTASSYLAASDPRRVFGLGPLSGVGVDSIVATLPDGRVLRHGPAPPGRYVVLKP